MKSILKDIIFGKSVGLSGFVAILIVLSVALGCTCGKDFDLGNLGKSSNTARTSNSSSSEPSKSESDGDLPSESVTAGLVKDTTMQLADAVDSGDFSTLYENASTDFRSSVTLEKLESTFKPYVDKKTFVVPILKKAADMDPSFSPSPSIRTERGIKILVADGKFDTRPNGVRFETEYVLRGGEWKMLKIVFNIP